MNETLARDMLRWRQLVVAPFLISALACMVLMLVALTSFGAGDEVDYPSWAPPLAGYFYALPVLAGSLVFAALVWRRTSQEYRIAVRRLILGLACVLAMIAITIAYIVVIDEPSSYYGKFNPTLQRYEANLTLSSLLWFSLLIAVFFPGGGFAALIKVLYLDAITPVGLDKPAGADPIGALIQEFETGESGVATPGRSATDPSATARWERPRAP